LPNGLTSTAGRTKPPDASRRNEMSRKTTGSLAAVETIRKRLDLSQAEFSEALGFGASSYGDMLRRGEITQTAALAAEALMRRQAPGTNDELCFVVRIVKGVPLVTLVEEAQTIVLNDQRFLLVPADLPRRAAPRPEHDVGNGTERLPDGYLEAPGTVRRVAAGGEPAPV
jgi:hypothetical protein